ncbi:hypothetical protein UC8_45840 [Roseimaritima ulvae]|uniref:Uncharacterized protein n=1 Tax=Roseimaritima ulvae TaxID=980254 RepID=A0A5B9QU57_9BACT|nr:hypothetical protein UC8_45840 [Roseimaritima ulvae]
MLNIILRDKSGYGCDDVLAATAISAQCRWADDRGPL